MVIEPRPWVGPKDGGYLTSRAFIARMRNTRLAAGALWQAHDEARARIRCCLQRSPPTPPRPPRPLATLQ